MDQLARYVGRKAPSGRGLAPNDDLPPEYWEALLEAAGANGGQGDPAASGRLLRLNQVPDHVLRVGCRRCGRTVEIQKADAVRLYGPESVWRDVGQRLLDDTCTQRTGRHEEDGCWPSFG
ncbi:conserved hypothetical protein [Bradyrhizobium sp. ORS 375]|uniref:hypothetical protein n=1 Tax=Bradyrhizobium sp. (strain ORS 375) TaxID=566679 RepID=UPI0002406AC0|nr:hypothetical protein [Bradyrhizobium sp. ORS 375]CCD97175.1 conserved hypothetical protein [Bradyrhizobium sp. ORS 375]